MTVQAGTTSNTVHDSTYQYILVYHCTWVFEGGTSKYILVHTLMNWFDFCWTRPPGRPESWKLNICCCPCSVTRHTSSSTLVFTFFILLPPPRHPLSWEVWGSLQGRSWAAGLLPALHCSCTCWILHPAAIPVMLQWCSSSNWFTKYPE